MNKLEFMTASLPNGLAIKNCIEYDILEGIYNNEIASKYRGHLTNFSTIEESIPIVRNLNTLTKKCIQADYNRGKQFIPIVELAKIMYPNHEWKLSKIGQYAIVDNGYMTFEYDYGYNCFLCNNSAQMDQIQLFQQLIRWHFDLITEDCEKVYVDKSFNPYK